MYWAPLYVAAHLLTLDVYGVALVDVLVVRSSACRMSSGVYCDCPGLFLSGYAFWISLSASQIFSGLDQYPTLPWSFKMPFM